MQSQPSAATTRALGAIAAFGSDYKCIGCNRSLWQRLQEFWVQSQPLAATTRASGAIAAFGSDYKCIGCNRSLRQRLQEHWCNRSLWQRLQELWCNRIQEHWVQSQPLAATTSAQYVVAAAGCERWLRNQRCSTYCPLNRTASASPSALMTRVSSVRRARPWRVYMARNLLHAASDGASHSTMASWVTGSG